MTHEEIFLAAERYVRRARLPMTSTTRGVIADLMQLGYALHKDELTRDPALTGPTLFQEYRSNGIEGLSGSRVRSTTHYPLSPE